LAQLNDGVACNAPLLKALLFETGFASYHIGPAIPRAKQSAIEITIKTDHGTNLISAASCCEKSIQFKEATLLLVKVRLALCTFRSRNLENKKFQHGIAHHSKHMAEALPATSPDIIWKNS
jgi:hypothetical protein